MVTADFQATTSADSIPAQWWLSIHGVRRRYGSHVPSWASAIPDTGTNRPVRSFFEKMPRFRGAETKPLDGSSKPMEFEVRIQDEGDELTELFSVHDESCAQTILHAAVTAGDLFIDVVDGADFTAPCDVFVNDETMRCTVINIGGGAGGSDRFTVTRGMYDSEDVDHPIENSQGDPMSIEVRDKLPFVSQREVTLYECRAGLAEADAIKFRGFIEDYEEDDGVWVLNCFGFLRRLSCTIGETLASTRLTTRALWGPESWNNVFPEGIFTYWCMAVEDSSGFILLTSPDPTGADIGYVKVDDEIIKFVDTAPGGAGVPPLIKIFDDLPSAQWWYFDDRTARRGLFSKEIYGSKGTIQGIHQKSKDEQVFYDIPRFMGPHDIDAEVKQIIHSDCFTTAWSYAQPRAPVKDVILTLLTSTGDGTNGAYDVLPEGWGAGIPVAKIDVTGIEQICSLPEIASLDLSPFAITEATDLKEWLEENVMRPCMLFFVETPDGLISVRRLYSKSEAEIYTTPTTVDQSVLLEIPPLRSGMPPIAKITFKVNWYPGDDEYYGTVNILFERGSRRYKKTGRNHELECKTIYDDRLNLIGQARHVPYIADLPDLLSCYLGPLVENFANNPCPQITFEVPYNRYIDVTVGQVCRVTCSVTPDLKNSNRGIVSEWFQIVKTTPIPENSSIKCEAWMIGIYDDDTRMLAPSAKVKSYQAVGALGDPRINLEDAEFADGLTVNLRGNEVDLDYDVDAFFVDDVINILDSQYRPKAGAVPETATIKAKGNGVGTCWVDLTGAPANPPAAGDYIDTSQYDNCVANQKDDWAYLADANAQLGAANADAVKRER